VSTARSFASVLGVALTAALACASCVAPESTCARLTKALGRCGLPVAEVDCDRLPVSDQGSLLQSLEERGCAGLARPGTSAVDARACTLGGYACPPSPTPSPSDTKPRYPVVLVSGIDGSPTFDWSPHLEEALRGALPAGVQHIGVLPWATTGERTRDLWTSLEAFRDDTGTSKVNLVCYAVGGLDCRWLVSPRGLFRDDPKSYAKVKALVASVTTVATPHRGTRVADAALAALEGGGAGELVAALVGGETAALPDTGALRKTLEGLGVDAMASFDREATDPDDAIVIQSFAGLSRALGRGNAQFTADAKAACEADGGAIYGDLASPDALAEPLWVTAPFSGASRDGSGRVVTTPSDGMVSVASARWGTFRGCIPADHYDVIGQIGHVVADVKTGFDASRFYLWVASDLAEKGL
jgi:triacylglycerol lipase